MKYLCTNCRYVIDEAFWDKAEAIDSGEKIEEGNMCPICEEYDCFHPIEEQVHYVDETDLEITQDHFPAIIIKSDAIRVVIGREPHPMGDNHRIGSVSLYDEYGDLIEEKFLEIDDEPVVEFFDHGLDEFEVRVKCSLHGVWGRKVKTY